MDKNMDSNLNKEYIIICGENKFQGLWLFLWCWIKKCKGLIMDNGKKSSFARNLLWFPPFKKYIMEQVRENQVGLGQYKGLWYKVNKEAIDLTIEFYNQEIASKPAFIGYYNKILRTVKFEAYIKKEISFQIFSVLKELHLVRLQSLCDTSILIAQTPLNEFIVEYMLKNYGTKYRVKYIRPRINLFILFFYYGQLLKEFVHRGIAFGKTRRKYKISKEATWNFFRGTLRDDILVDGNQITQKDVLLLEIDSDSPQRARSFQEAREKGFDTVSLHKIKININKDIYHILYFYLFVPLILYVQLFWARRTYLFNFIVLFHWRCFPWEVFLNAFDVDYYISVRDWGDVEETIILNRYDAKSVFFQRSDLSFPHSHLHAFIAHNLYFIWGDIHYDFHAKNYFVDKKIDIGCIYKRACNQAVDKADSVRNRIPLFNKQKKTVTFFDNSFQDTIHITTAFFLEFLEMVKKFCQTHKDVNVLFKPKKDQEDVLRMLDGSARQYNLIWDGLKECENFIYLDPWEWSIESVIAISNVCVNMGITSPSTIALICGKNALYYDSTGNSEEHILFRKHAGTIVFDNKEDLFRQIDNILEGRFNCLDVFSKKELREYDIFDDDKALERLNTYLSDGLAKN